MIHVQEVSLKDLYPFLDKNGADPKLVCMTQDYEQARPGSLGAFTRPAVLVIPGGGYTHYGTMEGDPIALEFLNRGYQAFILYYSVAPHHFPQQTLEAAAAMDYIRKNAKAFALDPKKVAMIGFSAGGHMIAAYSAFGKREEIERYIKAEAANAAILCYPYIEAPNVTTPGCLGTYLGRNDLSEEELHEFSVTEHITDLTPPTFLWHTVTDGAVPVFGTMRYARALMEHGIKTELHIYPEGPHALSTATRQTLPDPDGNIARSVSSWVGLAMRFLDITFGI